MLLTLTPSRHYQTKNNSREQTLVIFRWYRLWRPPL